VSKNSIFIKIEKIVILNFSAKLNDSLLCYVYLGILNFRAKNRDFVKVQNQQKLKIVEFLTIFCVKIQIMSGIN